MKNIREIEGVHSTKNKAIGGSINLGLKSAHQN